MNRNARVGMWLALCGLCLGLWLWREAGRKAPAPGETTVAARPAAKSQAPAKRAVKEIKTTDLGRKELAADKRLKPLSNTTQSEAKLLRNERALLLANALIDTTKPLEDLKIPAALRAPADGGTYIVQARGAVDAGFTAMLAGAGATTVSYIPNNAELVRVSAAGAQQLAANPLVASVVPWAPYFKLTDPGLLQVAVQDGGNLPQGVGLTLGVYGNNDTLSQTLAQLRQMKVSVVGQQPGPFGMTILQVHPAEGTFMDVARLDGVMVVEATHQRQAANDLTRVRLGAATNSLTTTNTSYLGLSGLNVTVNVNDTGVDVTHPDLQGRIILDPTASGTDPNGHGTHVIGTVLGNGSQSATVGTNAQGSPANALFSGLATNAQAFVMGVGMFTGRQVISGTPAISDAYLQETAGRQTNVFISVNAWAYGGSSEYDLAAASYDAAVRDAVPEVTGPHGLLYVFAAGNNGGGASDGSGGLADTIRSPGTGKNVIAVGGIEQNRGLTNAVVIGGLTNQNYFQPETDSSNQVAAFSSRGNVGIGIEGPSGRFKPDVVAPGEFLVSTKPANWDQAGYYNPTNVTFNTQFQQVVQDTNLAAYSLFVSPRAVQVTISIQTNEFSPSPMVDLPIYVRLTDNPTTNTYDFLGTNSITLTPGQGLVPGATVFFSIGTGTNSGVVNFDLQTAVLTTNDNGNLLTVVSNMNSNLGPYYRYESGTSMATAGVSGLLALMQEFLEQRLHVTNHSPALMKAMLINGSRTVSSLYDLSVATSENSQGWGLPNLSNSVPGVLTNVGATNLPLQFFDQTGTNALATGQSRTQVLKMSARSQPLRITLAWTDPAGNPAAGVKLVNDLDLIVTNLDTGEIFWGNDIPAGNDFNESSDTNGPPMDDVVNNVENVYLQPPLSTNYSVTVYGRHVNVNAVTSNTNNIVQDYALVMSYGDGGATSNAFTVSGTNTPAPAPFPLTLLTNGIPLIGQRVGANSQFSGSTNGSSNQWNFYIFTNTLAGTNAAFTNVAIVALGTANLGLPRMGAQAEVGPPDNQATRSMGPDLDLYVSGDPTLTNLNPTAIANAFSSTTRTGVEKVLFTNSVANQVYYIGVKSEDQEGAEYQFVAVALTNSFGQTDSNGNVVLTVITPPFPATIPSGTPAKPGSVSLWALTTTQAQARKVVVTDTITHQEFGDLVGAFSHGQKTVVLNNHSFFVNPGDATETFTYDDTGEGDFPGARHTDGPGNLESFIGDQAGEGLWILSMVNDSSANDTGSVDNLSAVVVPKSQVNGFPATVAPESWFYDFVDVPANATNLTLTDVVSAQEFLYLRRGAIPDQTHFDKSTYVPPPGTNLTISIFDSPPLNAGRYFIGIFNPNTFAVTNNVSWTFGFAPTTTQPLKLLSVGNEPLLDDAVTYSTNHVGANSPVETVEVGVRINHSRESDLVLTLISPLGTRVLLAENRGGLDTNGYGTGINVTNVLPQVTNGTALSNTNIIPVPTNSGTLDISYQFFTVPDDMRIYYDGVRIFDSGLINGAGTLSVDFGPGVSSNVVIVMNEPGSNPGVGTNSDLWNYTVTEVTQLTTYAIFTENTNLTTLPIKFAPPPFGAPPGFTPAVTNLLSGFDTIAPGDYTNTVGEGWTTTDTNPVKVVSVPQFADTPGNVLALHNGGIQQTLPTVAGRSYTLTFVNHGRPIDGPVSWWEGEGNAADSADGNTGALQNGAGTGPGLVGNAFRFNGTNQYVRVANSTNLNPSNSLSIESWIYLTTNTSSGIIMTKWGDAGAWGNQRSYSFFESAGNQLVFSIADAVTHQNDPAFQNFLSPPNSVPLNAWTHVAAVYNQATGTRSIYVDGTNVASRTDLPAITIFNGIADVGTGGWQETPAAATPGFFLPGNIDELSYYTNVLNITNIQDIYAAGSAGKCPIGGCSVLASVSLAGVTNAFIVGGDAWTTNVYTFTAPSNNTVLDVQSFPGQDGMLVDSFKLVQNPVPLPGNYYLPEESLDKLVGENALGDWKLEVLDNRAGATNPAPVLVSWELILVVDRVVPAAIPLTGFVPNTNTVLPGDFRYYSVTVPAWAKFATNLLITASAPVNIWFNQGQEPVGTNPPDISLATAAGPGVFAILTSNTVPPLVPGSEYYLGVQNTSAATINFTIEVDYDIIPLTNTIPYTNTIPATTLPQYYLYDVSSNAFAVAFEILHPTADVVLVARRGGPLPDVSSHDYFSNQPGTNNESIIVSSNSTPVALLTPGRWLLGVFNIDTNAATYAIRATEAGPPMIILLTNDVPYVMTNYAPSPLLNTFFEFDVTNMPPGVLFELYQLSGDVDLTLDRAALGATNLPYGAPFFASSTNSGTNGEQIVVRTNLVNTNLNSSWFLGVPNNAGSNVTFTIHAVVSTNGLLISDVPLNPVATLPTGGGGATGGPTLTWPTVAGETYEVQESPNLQPGSWVTIATITASGQSTTFTDPTPIVGTPARYYRIVQIP